MENTIMTCDRYYEFFSQYRIINGNYPGKRTPFVHGPAIWNYPSGNRMTEGYYNRGVRAGIWRWYSQEGEIIKTTDFECKEYRKRPFRNDESIYANFDIRACTPENTVLVSEDHGCACWIWMPDRSMDETVEWWRGLDSVEPYFLSPQLLPGITIQPKAELWESWESMENSGHYYFADLNEDYWSALISPSGERIYHKNYEYAVMAYHSVPRNPTWPDAEE